MAPCTLSAGIIKHIIVGEAVDSILVENIEMKVSPPVILEKKVRESLIMMDQVL